MDRARAADPTDSSLIIIALREYGQTLTQLRRYPDAEQALLKAHELLKSAERSPRQFGWVVWQLLELYIRWDEAAPGQGYDATAAEWRAKLPVVDQAQSFIMLGIRHLEDGQHGKAEAALRKCLEIRQESLPEGYLEILYTTSVLGESLARQGADGSLEIAARIEKLGEAEPLLIEAYEGMKEYSKIPDEYKREALQRIVDLYDFWHAADPDQGYDTKGNEWRTQHIQYVRRHLENLRRDAESPQATATALNAYAWELLTIEPTDQRDPPEALIFALQACELTDNKNAAYLDTLAMAHHLTGNHAAAVGTQTKAVSLLPTGTPDRDELEAHLAQFKAALAKLPPKEAASQDGPQPDSDE